MKSNVVFAVSEIDPSRIRVGMTISCYNPGGGKIIRNGTLKCSCEGDLITLKKDYDPGSSICCESVRLAYNLPETEKRCNFNERQPLKFKLGVHHV